MAISRIFLRRNVLRQVGHEVGIVIFRQSPKHNQVYGLQKRLASQCAFVDFAEKRSESEKLDNDWDNAKPFCDVPGPAPFPLLGNAWRFMPYIGGLSTSLGPLSEHLHARYGDVCMLKGVPGRYDSLFLYDPLDFEKVFRNDGRWPIREFFESVRHYIENRRSTPLRSLAVEQGRDWQEYRSYVNQVLMQPRNVKTMFPQVDAVAEDFIKRMLKIRDEHNQMPDNFAAEMRKFMMESITNVALGIRLGALQDDLSPDSDASRLILTAITAFDTQSKVDLQPSLWRYIPTPTYRKLEKSLDEFTEIAQKYVNKSTDRIREESTSKEGAANRCVLQSLLERTEDPSLGVGMVLDMLMAGVDTTSGAAIIALYLLATHPEKQRLLQEELDRVCPDANESLTYKHVEEMKYLRACIKEIHRLEPIVAFGRMRTTSKDMVIKGYQIPKGTRVVMNFLQLSKNEEFAKRGSEFLPERWLPGGESLRPKPFVYLPFGFGPRICVGMRVADLEIEVFLAKLLRTYTIEWHHPPPKFEREILFQYLDPMKFTMNQRV